MPPSRESAESQKIFRKKSYGRQLVNDKVSQAKMFPYCLSEDNRRKNQFSKDERLYLLNVMSQYAPLLDDKNASLFGRREIWRAIERDFHQAGFTSKTSAQLKKYWQNYKYHGKRIQTAVKKYPDSTSKGTMETPHTDDLENHDLDTMTAQESATPDVSPQANASLRNVELVGCRQRQIYEDNGTFFRKLSATPILSNDSETKYRSYSVTSQGKKFSSKVYEESKSSGVIDRKSGRPIDADVIVSNTDISNNSVTVSVICPERTPKLFSKNQPRRKREGNTLPDRSSFQSSLSIASDKLPACRGDKKFHLSVQPPAALPYKKRKDDDRCILPVVTGVAKRCCFLLQPQQADNPNEAISDKRNAVETRRKLEPVKEEVVGLPLKYSSESETLRSYVTRAIPSIADAFKKDFPIGVPPAVQNAPDSACRNGRCEESKICEIAAAQNQQNGFDAARTSTPVAFWDRDTVELVQSELRDELSYRLMLHRLETEEKRLKVKIAEMAIEEIRFRIRALNEDIRRADELHELHLALATAQAGAEGLHV